MAADLGSTGAWEPVLALVSGRLIGACALAGVMPLDSPFFDLHDEPGLEQEVARAVALGFPAKAAIHPTQIGTINAALTPSAEAVERARKILAENIKGVGTVDGQMVDEATRQRSAISSHAAVYNTFYVQRHLTSAQSHRVLRAAATSTWREVVAAA